MHPADGRVVSNTITQALRGAPITLYGSGRQTRSFCYVDDMIDGFIRLMESPAELCGPINLGNPTETTIADLAALVIELTGTSSRIEHGPLPEDDPMRRMPDITLARRALGWSPQIPIRDGIARTIDYFREPQAPRWHAA
jgi:UDP-glucuronate decarboxylase